MVKLGKKEQQKHRAEGYDLDFISRMQRTKIKKKVIQH
ncbi:hypothetical protein EC917_1249 [Bacillus thuringiensis]|uniref:Uncharacterized protein n=1 Tax=Bacillus thuringiensis TaxID=1428 RepID=A0A4V2WCD3_BACTU|nr:hypothetical protein EC917_1249 [Bacillus thuringiensis]TCW47694.1 hypothetical protein EC910_1239 [Bacillus thuringiensis]